MRLQGAGLVDNAFRGMPICECEQTDRKEYTTAKILRKCKKMAQLPSDNVASRACKLRSRMVESRSKARNCNPTFEGRDKQRNCDNCRV